jgi:mRNA-degrading endonuclease toxin of MazEF toxin-antitoxin module
MHALLERLLRLWVLSSGTETQGAVHCHQLKSLDWRVTKSEFNEIAPDFYHGRS